MLQGTADKKSTRLDLSEKRFGRLGVKKDAINNGR